MGDAKNAEYKTCKKILKCILPHKFTQFIDLKITLNIKKYYYFNKSLLTLNHDCFESKRFAPRILQIPVSNYCIFSSAHLLLKS
jgi:hypothetical protein